ncbi:MAG: type II toxin-antitoxin system HicB family antitoxin [Phycisphaeraceae bacterium]
MKYLAILETTDTGISAYVPDLPGVAITAANEQQARTLLAQAVALHIDGLRADGHQPPQPNIQAVDIEAPAA